VVPQPLPVADRREAEHGSRENHGGLIHERIGHDRISLPRVATAGAWLPWKITMSSSYVATSAQSSPPTRKNPSRTRRFSPATCAAANEREVARCLPSWVIGLVPWVWVFQCGDDGGFVGAERGRERVDGAVDLDGRRAQRPQGSEDAAERSAGAVLHGAGDGERGEHDGQVRFDRVALADEHRPRGEVGLGHAERLLNVPEVMVPADDLGRRHDGDGQVRDVALQSGRLPRGPVPSRPGPGSRRRS
jgi:hypothetical protein